MICLGSSDRFGMTHNTNLVSYMVPPDGHRRSGIALNVPSLGRINVRAENEASLTSGFQIYNPSSWEAILIDI